MASPIPSAAARSALFAITTGIFTSTDNLCLTNVLYRAPDAFRFLAGVSQLLPQEQEGNRRTGG
jgi:hypothetical protein